MKKFIVPFIGVSVDGSSLNFIGTAFIINKGLLISAGHNVRGDYSNMKKNIYFEDKCIELDSPIYDDGDNIAWEDGVYRDLVIYNISQKIDKRYFAQAFTLTDAKVSRDEELKLCGYHEIGRMNEMNAKINSPDFSWRHRITTKLQCVKCLNCISIYEDVVPGNSGCPIFRENQVLGMIVYGYVDDGSIRRPHEYGATAIKSDYIISCIETANLYKLS